jgi:hypothetical protein
MDGLFFLMSVVGIGIAMWWVMQNDAVPPDKPTRGLFAMLPGSRLLRRRGLRAWLLPAGQGTRLGPVPGAEERKPKF